MNKGLFLDRDGVINYDNKYVYKIEEFEFVEGIFEFLIEMQKRNYLLFIITNQAGIGRGYYSERDFHVLNDWMLERLQSRGIQISKVYYCPYHPTHGIGQYKTDSFFRKPNPGMILQAQNEFDIDLGESILIGDKETDIETGINSGVKLKILLSTENDRDSKAEIICNSMRDIINFFDEGGEISNEK